MRISRLVGAVGGATLAASIALAAGIYTNNVPYLVGNPLYFGFTTQAPTSLSGGAYTGNEGVPVDTNLPQGASPQTAALSIFNLLNGNTASTATNTTSFTATVAQMCVGGKQTVLLTGTLGANATVTTPTATACLANLPAGVGTAGGTSAIGYTWLVKFVSYNAAAFTWTVTAGTGFTITGPAATVASAPGALEYSCAVTAVATPAINCTYIGPGL